MTADGRFDRLDDSIASLSRYLIGFREEILQRLDLIEHRLDLAGTSISTLDTRVAALTKSMLDTGSLSAKVLRDQSDLSARVARLEEQVSKLLPAA